MILAHPEADHCTFYGPVTAKSHVAMSFFVLIMGKIAPAFPYCKDLLGLYTMSSLVMDSGARW